MIVTEIKIEPFEDSWRDWFIIDEPKEKIKISIILDETRHFYVDSRFRQYKMTALISDVDLNVYRLYYMFDMDPYPYNLQSINAYVKRFENSYASKKYLECILTRDNNV